MSDEVHVGEFARDVVAKARAVVGAGVRDSMIDVGDQLFARLNTVASAYGVQLLPPDGEPLLLALGELAHIITQRGTTARLKDICDRLARGESCPS